MREPDGYRRQFEDVLQFSGGARMLTLAQVKAYTGINDYRTLKRRFPFNGKYISASELANAMCKGKVER